MHALLLHLDENYMFFPPLSHKNIRLMKETKVNTTKTDCPKWMVTYIWAYNCDYDVRESNLMTSRIMWFYSVGKRLKAEALHEIVPDDLKHGLHGDHGDIISGPCPLLSQTTPGECPQASPVAQSLVTILYLASLLFSLLFFSLLFFPFLFEGLFVFY